MVRKDGSYANVFGIDNRQRPGGLFSKNFLHEKGMEQCDFFRYSAPSASSDRWADKAVFNKSENIFGDPPEARVFACAGIDAVGVGRGDEPSSQDNRLTYSAP